MKAIIEPAKLNGSIRAIASKSQAHRMLICAAFADRPTKIICRERSQDIDATAGCLRAMGCDISYDETESAFTVVPLASVPQRAVIDCGESGSTLRFLLPVVCALGIECNIVMHGRLSERPLSPLWEELTDHGCQLKKNEDKTISTSGKLKGGIFTLAADVSSQFISGLLFAMPLIAEKSELKLTGNVESKNYILMTIDAQEKFGIRVKWEKDRLFIESREPGIFEGNACKGTACRNAASEGAIAGNIKYSSPGEVTVEGDWSNAAFWLCASRLCGESLKVTGLNGLSVQGDRAVKGLIEDICSGNAIIDARDVPDLVPVLSVLAAGIKGETTFIHAERLKIKESDRIKTTVSMLKALGADCTETADGLKVKGNGYLKGGRTDSFNDHRIAMSAAVASVICRDTVEIENAEAVRKSYPDFWRHFADLGGRAVISD